ncbi:MAG: 16S rRNA (adenine(1518)-N(6)/adenine(1519)-N(6))-dimethyltransferase RsmA [Limisphaerales bacterium]
MKLSEMRDLLTQRNLQLTKSLGQNFLHDANQLRRIVDLGELRPTDRVLEVGPGLGPLTELLLDESAEVFAIEKDRRLVEILHERFPDHPRLTLIAADALRYIERERRDWDDWKLISNLPFCITSPLLAELALLERCPERLVATLQLEVVRRLVSGHGSKDYGVLTLLMQLRYESRGWFKIPPGCFFPAPDVDSGCVCLVRRAVQELSAFERKAFVRIVKRAFSERRKKALKLLKFDWPAEIVIDAWRDLGLSDEIRAERISRDQFVELARRLAGTDVPNTNPGEEQFDVVDDRDEVIDRRPRSEVHRLGLKHRAVHVLVFNARGELFLQKRSMTKDCFPGTWDSSASGHLGPGEDYDACAVREVEEELGWKLAAAPTRLFNLEACPETGQEFVWIYRTEAEGPFTLHPEEIEQGDWFAPAEVTRWLAERPTEFAGAIPLIWRRLQEAGIVPSH